MIKIVLPNLVGNWEINKQLLKLNRKHRDIFYHNLLLDRVCGNFAWCINSGEIYNNFSNLQSNYESIETMNNNLIDLSTGLDLDFSNKYYSDSIYDNYSELILDVSHNGCNRIEISDIEQINSLHQKYPFYKFIINENAAVSDINVLKAYLSEDLVDLVYINRDIIQDVLDDDTIELKRIGLVINPMCPLDCESLQECRLIQHNHQFSYSDKNVYEGCSKTLNLFENYQIYSIDCIVKNFNCKGLSNYKLEMFSPKAAKEDVIDFLTNYLIKPEHIQFAKDFINGRIVDD